MVGWKNSLSDLIHTTIPPTLQDTQMIRDSTPSHLSSLPMNSLSVTPSKTENPSRPSELNTVNWVWSSFFRCLMDRLIGVKNKKNYAEVESTDATPPFFRRLINITGWYMCAILIRFMRNSLRSEKVIILKTFLRMEGYKENCPSRMRLINKRDAQKMFFPKL